MLLTIVLGNLMTSSTRHFHGRLDGQIHMGTAVEIQEPGDQHPYRLASSVDHH